MRDDQKRPLDIIESVENIERYREVFYP